MKPVQYRNRNPIEYHPNDFRKFLKAWRHYENIYIAKWKPRKLPGIAVGVTGIVTMILGELLQGSLGILLFFVAVVLIAIGAHFEVMNRVHLPHKYFIVPAAFIILVSVYLIRPQFFGFVVPREPITQLSLAPSGFAIDTDSLMVVVGGGQGYSLTFTQKQLEQAAGDSLSGTVSSLPLRLFLVSGRLFVDADIFAGSDLPPIRIRRNVVHGLPYRCDGNYDGSALEIVNADGMPVFQMVFESSNRLRVNGVFQSPTRLIIADNSGITMAQGKRVLFYGIRPMFRYPSRKYLRQRATH